MLVITPIKELWNDLCDVARLFYSDALLQGESDGKIILHQIEEGQDRFSFSIDGQVVTQNSEPVGQYCSNTLENTRVRKRTCKNTLYHMLKDYTGMHLPWGCLTGIRPTRLFAEGVLHHGSESAAKLWLQDTFDVSGKKTQLLQNIAQTQAFSPIAQSDQCDVYIGIPFCPTRCSYCSFAAIDMAHGKPLVAPYMTALLHEIRETAKDLASIHKKARAVYVGGGTPTTLSPEQLEELLCELRSAFPHAIEWTVEAGRPDTIDAPKLAVLRKYGVDRISINPQTMHDKTLQAIGREHSAQDIVQAMELVRQFDFSVVNMDLIVALPGETMKDVQSTLAQVIDMGVENITVHTLAIKRASQMRMSGNAEIAPEQLALAMVDVSQELLGDAHYHPYYLYRQKYMAGNLENVGYAKQGTNCLYNIGNMEETVPVLACGAGAISKWLYAKDRRIERAPNVRNIEEYIARVDDMITRKRKLYQEEIG